MNATRNQQIIMGVLILVLVVVFAYQFGFIGGSGETPTPPPAPGAAPGAAPAAAPGALMPPALQVANMDIDVLDKLLEGIKVVTFNYETNHPDRSPMTPLVGVVRGQLGNVPATGTALAILRKKVTGIIYDANNPLAVVDDEVVSLGYEYPDGTRVYAIEPTRVIFQMKDTLVPVEMKEL